MVHLHTSSQAPRKVGFPNLEFEIPNFEKHWRETFVEIPRSPIFWCPRRIYIPLPEAEGVGSLLAMFWAHFFQGVPNEWGVWHVSGRKQLFEINLREANWSVQASPYMAPLSWRKVKLGGDVAVPVREHNVYGILGTAMWLFFVFVSIYCTKLVEDFHTNQFDSATSLSFHWFFKCQPWLTQGLVDKTKGYSGRCPQMGPSRHCQWQAIQFHMWAN